MIGLAKLIHFEPEQIEGLFERVFRQYGQGFKVLGVQGQEVLVELEDGKQVKVNI